ncbi:hypothetical protein ACUNV4_24780 [Granulosicoccus sp. 3-233]|uniref:hypothetical protein n=1 Tax=Granulosicoccus sp. 3-233 TaxID=3417969 RepID=UPI003D3531EC
MTAYRRTAWLYLLLLVSVISLLAWPAFVLSSTLLAYFTADAWQLEAWTQLPKRVLLQHFLDGYQRSLIVAVPAGILAALDHLLMSRLRITWWFRGILLPLAALALASSLMPSVPAALPTLLGTGLLLAVACRLFDLLLGRFFRGSR